MNIFQDPTKAMPPKDNHDTVRSRLEEAENSGKKTYLSRQMTSKDMSVRSTAGQLARHARVMPNA